MPREIPPSWFFATFWCGVALAVVGIGGIVGAYGENRLGFVPTLVFGLLAAGFSIAGRQLAKIAKKSRDELL